MMAPPTLRSVDPPGRGYTCRGSRLLFEWVQDQGQISVADEKVGQACGVSRQAARQWRDTSTGSRPRPRYWASIQTTTGIAPEEWETWELLTAEEPQSEPDSSKRPVAELPELKGSPAERARTLETWLEARARSGHGLSLDIDRSVRALLSSIQAQVRAKPIPDLHEHPDFEAFFDIILGALAKHPGAAKAVIGALKSRLSVESEAA